MDDNVEHVLQFLREKRNTGDDILQRIKDNKLDPHSIMLMSDEQLASFLPAEGDRVALVHYCLQAFPNEEVNAAFQNAYKCTQIKRLEASTRINDQKNKKLSKKTQSERTVHFGLRQFKRDTGKFSVVKELTGGGIKKRQLSKQLTKMDLLLVAKNIFFPDGKSTFFGSIEEYSVDILFFNEAISDTATIEQLCIIHSKKHFIQFNLRIRYKVFNENSRNFTTVNSLQGNVERNVTRATAATEAIAATEVIPATEALPATAVIPATELIPATEALSATEEIAANEDNSNSETAFFLLDTDSGILQNVSSSASNFRVLFPNTSISNDISFFHNDAQEDVSTTYQASSHQLEDPDIEIITFVAEDAPTDTLTDTPTDTGNTIEIKRITVFEELLSTFDTDEKLNKNFSFRIKGTNGELEKGVGLGVHLEIYTEFTNVFYTRYTEGVDCKVPTITDTNLIDKEWTSVCRVFIYFWRKYAVFPVMLSKNFMESVIFGVPHSTNMSQFISFLPPFERELVKNACTDFAGVDSEGIEDMINFLEQYHCSINPTSLTIERVLNSIAQKVLVMQPEFVRKCWADVVMYNSFHLTYERFNSIYEDMVPTISKVLRLLSFPTDMNAAETNTKGLLQRYIKRLTDELLRKLLRFWTGSDLLIPDCELKVEFNATHGFSESPTATTCSKTLHLTSKGKAYTAFQSEFNNLLESNILEMTAV